MNFARALFATALAALLLPSQVLCGIDSIIGKLKDAVVGSNVYHHVQKWEFDPHEAARRRPEFEALHGHHSVYLIERLGLGRDGRMEERRQQQAIRDSGILVAGRDYAIPVPGHNYKALNPNLDVTISNSVQDYSISNSR